MSVSQGVEIGIADIEAAATRLQGVAVRTPLLSSSALDEAAGGRVLLKPESLQVTGSFKIRGAYNLMSQLSPAQARKGVVAWSSGNHAQGVAAAGTMLGIATKIVMPEDAPAAKIRNTRRLGGETVLYDRYTGNREEIARAIAAEQGSELVPSYDHPDIVAGQGTVGLELIEQCAERNVVPDQVLICCGGGGLSSGSAIAIKARSPGTAVHTVEPAGFDDTARSLQSGVRERNDPAARSICDALQTESPGELPFTYLKKLAGKGLVVTDDEVRSAMRFAFRHLKLVVEPGGAVALAAVLAGKVTCAGKTTVVVLSGGNVDTDLFATIQQQEDDRP
ncbi:MAG: threonine/serine dehydratase [Gammaproteobacteria bacterium]|nr:threonine/serine dehydratase [Gammaproteobacteria bacterium]MDH4315630.1 threonine/serine dehydratase [Gammaproteobacteria bacterium]MDH5215503.1 threonine/serine dehydratase [Gammaproteobacteria bacterium]